MKLLLIAYNEAIDEEVMELLEAAGAQGYTKWTRVLGKGAASGPHLLSHVWPQGNHLLMVAAEDQAANALLESVRNYRQSVRKEGLKAFLLPLEQVT
ncbi:MAG: hypothetical protein AMJ81_00925 [Phycisphaerae bacterium SM23_33]|jgi:nitrogen regulatory protein PII|nr:MAG: hypothetical protein AMJ81_00925 [Phycisphaerae bacterium SM23_33]